MEKQWRKSLKTRAIALFSLIFLGFCVVGRRRLERRTY
jgi:hypothetical protein